MHCPCAETLQTPIRLRRTPARVSGGGLRSSQCLLISPVLELSTRTCRSWAWLGAGSPLTSSQVCPWSCPPQCSEALPLQSWGLASDLEGRFSSDYRWFL